MPEIAVIARCRVTMLARDHVDLLMRMSCKTVYFTWTCISMHAIVNRLTCF
jgi:hypothetical protein